jgi:hypothetical protein
VNRRKRPVLLEWRRRRSHRGLDEPHDVDRRGVCGAACRSEIRDAVCAQPLRPASSPHEREVRQSPGGERLRELTEAEDVLTAVDIDPTPFNGVRH